MTKWGPKLVTSPSMKAMRSPWASRRATRMAWPFPPLAESPPMTRAPARAATSPVPSVEPSSTTTTSSTRASPPPPSVRWVTMLATIGPMVAASLRAGMQTDTVRPALAATSSRAVEVAVGEHPGSLVVRGPSWHPLIFPHRAAGRRGPRMPESVGGAAHRAVRGHVDACPWRWPTMDAIIQSS